LNSSPSVAFFDSGQGGLTVWEMVCNHFPKLNTVYLADNARYPFGNKGADTVTRYSAEAAYFCAERQAQLFVIACGTASSVAVERLRGVFRFPIIGIVEGFCEKTHELRMQKKLQGSVAVLGTRYTVSSGRFKTELNLYGINEVWQRACPLFVPLVEEGVVDGPIIENLCQGYLFDIPQNVSVVMLACTHFPRLEKAIAQYLGALLKRTVVSLKSGSSQALFQQENCTNTLYLMDSSLGIVDNVAKFLAKVQDRNQFFTGEQSIYCTDAPERFKDVASHFSSREICTPEKVILGH
jgi:glutamate racemase